MTVASLVSEGDKPRVIYELKKKPVEKQRLAATNSLEDDGRPKISGELLWSATPTQWHVKLAEVRQGSLLIHCCATGAPEFRLPLHHLNLQAGHTPRTFTLSTGHGIPLATFQTLTEDEYQRWVRILAVEVLRQTPLQDVRFLDIIGITRGEHGLRRGRSEECLSNNYPLASELMNTNLIEGKTQKNKHTFKDDCKRKKERTEFSQWLQCVKNEGDDESKAKMDFDMKNMKIRRAQRVRPKLPFADIWNKLQSSSIVKSKLAKTSGNMKHNMSASMDDLRRNGDLSNYSLEKPAISDESGISSGDENNVNLSDNPCQNSEHCGPKSSYISVREKKQFFESLSGEVVSKKKEVTLNRSSSIGNIDKQPPANLARNQRASSMQDLSGNLLPVKEMRRLFEGDSANDLSKSYEDFRIEKSGENNFESESYGNSKSPVDQLLVHPIVRIKKETVSYANIQVCKPKDVLSKSVRFTSRKDRRPTIHETGLEKVVEEKHHRDYENCNYHWEEKEETLRKMESRRETMDRIPCSSQLQDGQPESKSLSDAGTSSPCSETKEATTLLIQRKLQRGERKLGKLRIQIAEVEETIKIIAEDLHSIGPNTLKRRSGLEVFAALRRRLEEETSRLERLQEETAKVISDNQRTILKLNPIYSIPRKKPQVPL